MVCCRPIRRAGSWIYAGTSKTSRVLVSSPPPRASPEAESCPSISADCRGLDEIRNLIDIKWVLEKWSRCKPAVEFRCHDDWYSLLRCHPCLWLPLLRTGGSCSNAATAVGPRPVYGTDPDLQERSRHVYQTDILDEQGGAGVLRSGLSDDVRLRQGGGGTVVPRSVETRCRLRDLLLGRSVGVGVVPQRADERRGSAACVRRGAEGAGHQGPRDAEGARAHRGNGGALRREGRC